VGSLLLAMVLGCSADSDLRLGPGGRPELAAGAPGFSLSHCGDHVALAVAPARIGVDVEGPRPPSEALVARMMTAGEAALLKVGDPRLFTVLWTLKEALAKADGRGLSLGDPVEVRPLMAGAMELWGARWLARTFDLPGAVLSVVAEDGFPGVSGAVGAPALEARLVDAGPPLLGWLAERIPPPKAGPA
jgi:hypothetical protein